jgi:uncharacterized protein DUF3443
MAMVFRYPVLVLFGSLVLLPGCGGGGGGGGNGAPANVSPPPPTTGGNLAPNVLPISVEPGPANAINLVFANVTVCPPGNGVNCQTIDHVLIDTGSSGLRIISSVLSSSLSLPQQTDAGGNPIVACAQFADGFSWGPVKVADVRIAGQQANSLHIQVIGDPAFSSIPPNCSNTGASRNAPQSLGANGILGIGALRQDCGRACALSSTPGFYYACSSSGCQPVVRSLDEQLQNPVSTFASDNNGIAIRLPAVPSNGAATVDGSLTLGIGTQPNNGLGTALVFSLNPNTGTLTTFYKNRTLDNSFIDSGSNVLLFEDASIPFCSGGSAAGLYCPASTQNLAATMQGANGVNASINFEVANADSLLTNNPGFAAFSNVASSISLVRSFDWGLPFFFGRNVFVAIEGANTPAGPGPYVAF